MRFFAIVLAALLASAPALAGKGVVEAEHERLSDEMDKLAQRQVWAGVERKYRELERLGVDLTEQDYLHGAYAARELGHVLACYERLKVAARINGTKEIVDWLWDIDHNYGNVELVSVPPRSAELTTVELPFDPNQRNAVEAAIKSAATDGIFVGMLPKGDYVFASQPFSVEPGVSVRIEVSPKMRRQGLAEPLIVYHESTEAVTTASPQAGQPSPEDLQPDEETPDPSVEGSSTQTPGQ